MIPKRHELGWSLSINLSASIKQQNELIPLLDRLIVCLVRCTHPIRAHPLADDTPSESGMQVLGRLSFDKTPLRQRSKPESPTCVRAKNNNKRVTNTPASSKANRKRARRASATTTDEYLVALSPSPDRSLDNPSEPGKLVVDGLSNSMLVELRAALHLDRTHWLYESFEDTLERTLLLILRFAQHHRENFATTSEIVTNVLLAVADQLLFYDRLSCLRTLFTRDHLALVQSLLQNPPSKEAQMALVRTLHHSMRDTGVFSHLIELQIPFLCHLTLHLQKKSAPATRAKDGSWDILFKRRIVDVIHDMLVFHGSNAAVALGIDRVFSKTDIDFHIGDARRSTHAIKMTYTQCAETQPEESSKDLVALPRLLLFLLDCIRDLDHAPDSIDPTSHFEILRQCVVDIMSILRRLSACVKLGELLVCLEYRLAGLAIVNHFLNHLVHPCLQTKQLRIDAEALELELSLDDDGDGEHLTQSVEVL